MVARSRIGTRIRSHPCRLPREHVPATAGEALRGVPAGGDARGDVGWCDRADGV